MLFELMIVDDEEIVRNGLIKAVDWGSLGFYVKRTAENGLIALKMIKASPPHVILTDVRMPEMDGLELLKSVNQLYPKIRVVMLSAYDDFKYAQNAMKYDAKGYLLKPLEEQELTETFSKLFKELELNSENGSLVTKDDTIESDDSSDLILKAKKYVYEHYVEKITLEMVSEFLHITPAYFSVLFKKITGQSFIDFVTHVKIEKSKEMLMNSIFRIREIALKVGYDDYTYFCKVFKKKESITPLEFRSKALIGK